ncbi:MAG: hypothetical protein NUV51_08075, partial [Sulfuricaulis sp.]|nr:hypothetical protein [Sulfuricaulis sp.]
MSGARGCIVEGAYSYWVVGNTVSRVDSEYTATTLGAIGTSTGEVGIASNGLEILIVDGASGWIINLAAGTLTEITDPDFPSGVKRATYQDGF